MEFLETAIETVTEFVEILLQVCMTDTVTGDADKAFYISNQDMNPGKFRHTISIRVHRRRRVSRSPMAFRIIWILSQVVA